MTATATLSAQVPRHQWIIAAGALGGIILHLALRAASLVRESPVANWLVQLPLLVALFLGGGILVAQLARRLLQWDFGSDLLAGISIVTSVLLGEYLAGTIVVLMLAGGEALEAMAVRTASSVLATLARRMPTVAHRKTTDGIADVRLDDIAIGDILVVFPHETCPVDGTVTEGRSVMDESYLTGEPYRMPKTPGSTVLSGSINSEGTLVIRADALAQDSRYAKIMRVMHDSEQRRPRLRRLGDQLGAIYTPIALAIALASWVLSGEPVRFLAVLVVATPCPLLIAIPVAIIGAISLAARRGIIVRDPAVLERLDTCTTAIFDKTGTLTFGEPALTEVIAAPGVGPDAVVAAAASLERYSKHPLAAAVLGAAKERGVELIDPDLVGEKPGEGLKGRVADREIWITNRMKWQKANPDSPSLPAQASGMECVVAANGKFLGLLRFRDEPRPDGAVFIEHLGPKHRFNRYLLVSGDRRSEVEYLADQVGIEEVHFSQTPEQKVERVRAETARAPTLFVGDGINDAPALAAATVGIAFGRNCDVASEAAGAVVLDSSLERLDEFLHIGGRMRAVALQSAVGGMVASVAGMLLAAFGYLPPVGGAILQEFIDVAAVLNAIRAAAAPRFLSDYGDRE